jgi:hypothetical protein
LNQEKYDSSEHREIAVQTIDLAVKWQELHCIFVGVQVISFLCVFIINVFAAFMLTLFNTKAVGFTVKMQFVVNDIRRFIKDPGFLAIWSPEYFYDLVSKMNISDHSYRFQSIFRIC